MVRQDTHLGATEYENERKLEPTSLPNKHAHQNQQRDLCSTNYRSVGVSADPSTVEPAASRRNAPANSKRSGTKGEVCFLYVYLVGHNLPLVSLKEN